MSQEATNWWIITGGPRAGKTTLIDYLSDLGYKTMPEAARDIIDEGISQGKTIEEIRADELAFQYAVSDLKEKRESEVSPQELVFWDRGLSGDSAAYSILTMAMRYNPNPIDPDDIYGHEHITILTKRYQGIFLLDRLPYEKDYARTEDASKAASAHKLIYYAYRIFRYQPIRVPVLPIPERAQFILDQVKKNPNLTPQNEGWELAPRIIF